MNQLINQGWGKSLPSDSEIGTYNDQIRHLHKTCHHLKCQSPQEIREIVTSENMSVSLGEVKLK
jgi:hypothetical protein